MQIAREEHKVLAEATELSFVLNEYNKRGWNFIKGENLQGTNLVEVVFARSAKDRADWIRKMNEPGATKYLDVYEVPISVNM